MKVVLVELLRIQKSSGAIAMILQANAAAGLPLAPHVKLFPQPTPVSNRWCHIPCVTGMPIAIVKTRGKVAAVWLVTTTTESC